MIAVKLLDGNVSLPVATIQLQNFVLDMYSEQLFCFLLSLEKFWVEKNFPAGCR